MNRRDFTRWAFAGTALSAVLDPASLLASTALPARSQQKQNARKTFQGFENSLRPSFSPDFAQLDEAGIRHDVRQSIAHGVFSIFCVPAGLNGAERDQFLQLVADENQGQVLLSTFLGGPTLASHMSQLKSAQAAGFNHVLAHPPGQEPVDSKDSLYAYYRQIADGTDMDVVLWATDGGNMRHLHPSNVVLDVLERVAELDNVVALKVMATPQTGAITLIQRFGSALNLNIHFHMLFLDGFYISGKNGTSARFRRVKAPTGKELTQLTHTIAQRTARYLERQGLLERDGENSYLTSYAGDNGPMDQLLEHSITYRIAVGPQQGRKVFTLQTLPDCSSDNPVEHAVGKVAGFSLHAGVAAKAHERAKLERLCHYIARPTVSTKRLSLTRNGQVRYELKTPWRNGTTHVIFEPLDFMYRMYGMPRAQGCA